MTAKAIMGLLPENSSVSGKVIFENNNLLNLNEKIIRKIRGAGIGMIFQEPMTALNPVLSIGKQMTEALVINGVCNQTEANERAVEMLNRVSITETQKTNETIPTRVFWWNATKDDDCNGNVDRAISIDCR